MSSNVSSRRCGQATSSLAAAARGAGRLRGRYPAKTVPTEVNTAERSVPTGPAANSGSERKAMPQPGLTSFNACEVLRRPDFHEVRFDCHYIKLI